MPHTNISLWAYHYQRAIVHFFPEGVRIHQSNNGSPILPLAIYTITPLITNKHSLQLKLTLKQTLKRNEVGGKVCDCQTQLPISCTSPHETKKKSMVVYEFGDTPSLIDDLLDEGNFPHILKHQINTM